jgi:hypothetical protein
LNIKNESEKRNRDINVTCHYAHDGITDVATTSTDITFYHRRHRMLQNCVDDEFHLRQVIENASNFLLTFIDICVQYINY